VESGVHTITTPTRVPGGLTAPTLVSAVNSSSIYVEWDAPVNPGGEIDQYQVRNFPVE